MYPVITAGMILVFIFGCEKEDSAELARLGTLTFSEITPTSVIISGTVEHGGGVNVTSRGIVWSTSQNPTIDDNEGQVAQGSGTGEFVITITGLSPATKYYVRGYATNREGTAYSSQFEVTTEGGAATVITAEVTEITANSAISGGNITDDGGAEITARGVVWSTGENPAIDENEGMTVDGEGIGEFTSQLIELSPGTTYYVRAYATNSQGTAYGNRFEFNTLSGPPVVTTSEVSGVTSIGAIFSGNVVDDGGVEVTARGIVWSTSEEPSVDDNEGIIPVGEGTGSFAAAITGLTARTTYYVRAYATNSAGTGYGNQVEFTTIDYPEVSTEPVTAITDGSASITGRVIDDGGATTERGIVWSTAENPTMEINEGMTIDGTGTGFFTSDVSGLNSGTTYFASAYAKNNAGVSYGEQVEFTTYDGRVEDVDENIYYYVIIGEQEWMVSNLKTTKLKDGASIPEVQDNTDWKDILNPAYCWYGNDGLNNKDVFGALYNFYAVETEKLCPEGWRVPTGPDVGALIDYLGGQDVAGGKLKGTGYIYWNEPNTGATDEVRFNALPGGLRLDSGVDFGQYRYLNEIGAWWVSLATETGAYTFGVNNVSTEVYTPELEKEFGASVRCMRGDPPPDPGLIIIKQ